MQLPPDAPQAAQSAQSTAAVHRPAAPAPSMARERLCWAPWTGPTNGRRVSGVTSYLYTPPTRSAAPDDAPTLRCLAPLRADRPGHVHHSAALGDLFGRVPGAPPEWPTGSQPTTSCRGPGATCNPWGHGWGHGWRSPLIRRDTGRGAACGLCQTDLPRSAPRRPPPPRNLGSSRSRTASPNMLRL